MNVIVSAPSKNNIEPGISIDLVVSQTSPDEIGTGRSSNGPTLCAKWDDDD